MTSASARPRQEQVARILDFTGTASAPVARPALILMAGLPGSGKSTFARRVAAATGATVLESDAIRQMLFHDPTHETAESRALFAAIFAAADELLRAGRTVIIDATNLRHSDRQPAHELAASLNCPLPIVQTSAPEAVILERLDRREIARDRDEHSLAGVAVYRLLAEEIHPITPRRWRWSG